MVHWGMAFVFICSFDASIDIDVHPGDNVTKSFIIILKYGDANGEGGGMLM